jgi:hypothetical protein
MRTLTAEQFSAGDRELLKQAAEQPHLGNCRELNVANLGEIAAREGIEFATALAYDRVLRQARNREFFDLAARSSGERIDPEVLFAIVPGAFYQVHKHSGADGARLVRILRSAGARVEMVPFGNLGRVQENARLIAEWLRARSGEKVVLLSLSKGSADVKVALRERPELADKLLGWVSLSGISNGTALVDWLVRQRWRMVGIRFYFWWRRLELAALEDLRTGGSLEEWGSAREKLPLVNVCGFPLQRHLTHRWAPKGYRRLARLGPNDGGGILLGEVTQRPGIIFPVWGTDHYLTPSWDCEAQLRTVLALAAAGALRQRHASECAK